MYLAVVPQPPGPGAAAGWRIAHVSAQGQITNVRDVDEVGLAAADQGAPRWLFDSVDRHYPSIVAAGVTVSRCHDISGVERILLSREGIFDAPLAATAIAARAAGQPAPADPIAAPPSSQPDLFDSQPDPGQVADPLPTLALAIVNQRRRAGADPAVNLLLAAESAAALAAVEMSQRGLPWDVDEHDRVLTAILGPRPPAGVRPAKMAFLAEQIVEAFGFAVNPDSATDLRTAFRRAGFDLASTSRWVLRGVDHPAVEPTLRYKELARLHTANGWNWLAEWVRDGRLRSEFLPGGVVSGRWATRGGGGLQIPKAVRSAARAEVGYSLVVADAAQLEPRVLAAISKDDALQRVSAGADLYQALATDGFGGDRAAAKLAMLGAMYGQTSGEAGRLLATLRTRYPAAMRCVESAAEVGERGGVVRSVLGRASPPPKSAWQFTSGDPEPGPDADDRRAREYARAWGRFTRNFVVQASAADWAGVWLAALRRELRAVPGAELVFFQHDELVLHVPDDSAEVAAELARLTAVEARDLVFPGSAVQTPVRPLIVNNYAEAK